MKISISCIYYKTEISYFPIVKEGRYSHITDAELLAHYYADNNLEWMGILLERYTLLLLGVCMKYLKNEEEAKDGVQQIFLKVLHEAPKYKIEYFKSWLYQVAKNHCLMRLRSQKGKITIEATEITMTALQTEEAGLEVTEQTYQLLEAAIEDLNTEQRQCIILFYLEKKSYTQISDKTGYSLLQVKSYIQNGKRNLKLVLQKKLKAVNGA